MENLVIKYKPDETEKLYSHYCNFMISCASIQNNRGKDDPIIEQCGTIKNKYCTRSGV
jgi:hypothetical protein